MYRIVNYGVTSLAGNRRGGSLNLGTGAPVVVTPEIYLTAAPSAITEDGDDITVSFNLTTQPSSVVVVTVSSDDTTALTTRGGSFVSFSTSNWATPQSITLTAPEDNDYVDETVTVTLTATTADSDYSGLTNTFTVTVTDIGQLFYFWDNNSPQTAPSDGAGEITSATISGDTDLWLTLTESSGSNEVEVTLANSDDTAIDLESNVGGGQFNDLRLNTYTNGNWNQRGGGHSFEVTPATGSSVGDTSTITATVTSTGNDTFDTRTTTIVLTVGS